MISMSRGDILLINRFRMTLKTHNDCNKGRVNSAGGRRNMKIIDTVEFQSARKTSKSNLIASWGLSILLKMLKSINRYSNNIKKPN